MSLISVAGIVLLLLAVVAAAVFWFRSRMDQPAMSFRAHLRHMEKDLGAADRYQTPWVLVVGDDAGVAPGLCQSWRLQAEGKRQWFGQWWYGADGALLLTPAEMFGHAEGAVPQLSAWRRLLRALLRVRARRPLDAVLWLIPAVTLRTSDQSVAAGLAAYRKFADLQQRLGLSLPVYLVITGIERVPGLLEFAQRLPDHAHSVPLGWSAPHSRDAPWRSDWLDTGLDQICATLTEEITEVGALSGGVTDELYLLPRVFDGVRANLLALCDPVFRGNALGEAPVFRGLYFVGAWSIAEADPDEFAEPGGASPIATPLFAEQLLRERILAETGVAQPIPRILAVRRRWQRTLEIAGGVLALLWFCGMVWQWVGEHTEANTLAALLQPLKEDRGGNRPSLSTDEAAGASVRSWWRLITGAPRWQFATPVYPTSLLSGVDNQIKAVVVSMTHDSLFLPLHSALQRDMDNLRSIGTHLPPADQGSDTDMPDTWPRYVAARQLAEAATQSQRGVEIYNRALSGSPTPADDATDLAAGLFKLDIRSSKLPARADLNALLAAVPGRLGSALDASRLPLEVGPHFSALMQTWLDRLYADDQFAATADTVQRQLDSLRSGEALTGLGLSDLNGRIDQLSRRVAATDTVWNRNGTQELVPGYAALLDRARSSKLIGPGPVAEVNHHADVVRDAFKTRWVSDEGPRSGVLQQVNGTIRVADEVSKLNVAIGSLLGQDFMSALRTGVTASAGISRPNPQSLAAALRDYAAYHKYVEQGALQVPETYRRGLMASVQSSAAQAMWNEIAGPGRAAGGAADAAQGFAALVLQANDVAAGFEDLQRHDLASALTEQMNRVAVGDLNSADLALQDMAAYTPLQATFAGWNGARGASLVAWRVGSVADLQQYLAGQAQALASLANSVAPAIAWLDAHPNLLRANEPAQLQRWKSLGQELQKYKDKNSTSAPALLEHLITKELNDMDAHSCGTLLAAAGMPQGDNEFVNRARDLLRMAGDRCRVLRAGLGGPAWQKLGGYFGQFLAGRFPFSTDPDAPDADPERVSGLLHLLDTEQSGIDAALLDLDAPQAAAAREFMAQLRQAALWLGPLLLRDANGSSGIDIDVDWRTERSAETGANQVIEWSLQSGDNRSSWPGPKTRVHWAPGDPVTLGLRWAREGLQQPRADPDQPALQVEGPQALWAYQRNWALLRLVQAHRASEARAGDSALMAVVPVGTAGGKATQARLFLRLALFSEDGKKPIKLTALPSALPPSPFTVQD